MGSAKEKENKRLSLRWRSKWSWTYFWRNSSRVSVTKFVIGDGVAVAGASFGDTAESVNDVMMMATVNGTTSTTTSLDDSFDLIWIYSTRRFHPSQEEPNEENIYSILTDHDATIKTRTINNHPFFIHSIPYLLFTTVFIYSSLLFNGNILIIY